MPSSVSDNISADSETEEIMKAAAAETEPVRESDGEDCKITLIFISFGFAHISEFVTHVNTIILMNTTLISF